MPPPDVSKEKNALLTALQEIETLKAKDEQPGWLPSDYTVMENEALVAFGARDDEENETMADALVKAFEEAEEGGGGSKFEHDDEKEEEVFEVFGITGISQKELGTKPVEESLKRKRKDKAHKKKEKRMRVREQDALAAAFDAFDAPSDKKIEGKLNLLKQILNKFYYINFENIPQEKREEAENKLLQQDWKYFLSSGYLYNVEPIDSSKLSHLKNNKIWPTLFIWINLFTDQERKESVRKSVNKGISLIVPADIYKIWFNADFNFQIDIEDDKIYKNDNKDIKIQKLAKLLTELKKHMKKFPLQECFYTEKECRAMNMYTQDNIDDFIQKHEQLFFPDDDKTKTTTITKMKLLLDDATAAKLYDTALSGFFDLPDNQAGIKPSAFWHKEFMIQQRRNYNTE